MTDGGDFWKRALCYQEEQTEMETENETKASFSNMASHYVRSIRHQSVRRLPPRIKKKQSLQRRKKTQKLLATAGLVARHRCCSKKCALKLGQTGSLLREQYAKVNEKGRTQILIAFIRFCEDLNSRKWRFVVQGKRVCTMAVLNVFGCGRKKFQRARRICQAGGNIPVHGNYGAVKCSEKKLVTIAWLQTFFLSVGEKMPTNEIHLPIFMRWSSIHELYRSEVSEPYSYTAFKACCTVNFPKVSAF